MSHSGEDVTNLIPPCGTSRYCMTLSQNGKLGVGTLTRVPKDHGNSGSDCHREGYAVLVRLLCLKHVDLRPKGP